MLNLRGVGIGDRTVARDKEEYAGFARRPKQLVDIRVSGREEESGANQDVTESHGT
jgi:hypothetical protein